MSQRRRRHRRQEFSVAGAIAKLVVWVVAAVLAIAFSPFILMVILIRWYLNRNRPPARPVRKRARKARIDESVEEDDPALKYGSKGTFMYSEAKKWGTDPRMFED